MTLVLSHCDLSEPTSSWIPPRAASFTGDEPGCPADDVVLAGLWLRSGAGIPYLWLVERGATGRPTVHLYERDGVTGTYVVTGVHHDHLKLSVPFTIDIDLTEIDDM
ncbi:hypothetical protein [Streptomyces sp. HPF1205]|uniref:hypothetical protein n=1 Tax=Streptomyces sp. HPF1205 TaxID=2873262 RepID=UPI001CECD1BE|nr:hypothetical protein [Streptomyces sp. HPF1205]